MAEFVMIKRKNDANIQTEYENFLNKLKTSTSSAPSVFLIPISFTFFNAV